jgi:NACalpha-BTF3-like transcription factor
MLGLNERRKDMEITLEAVEKVMEQTGVDYKAAKEALTKTDGDVDAAIKLIQPDTKDLGEDIKEVMDKLKKKVEEGNVDRVQIKKGNEVVFSVPVNIGIIGGIIGLTAAPWALIAGSVAAFGLGCRLEVVKKDGTTDEIK